MALKIAILREGGGSEDGDVVIDARGAPQFYDVIILSGRELKSVIATGAVSNGVPIGIGKHTKKPVAAVVGGKVYIRGIPLTLYEEAGILQRELLEALHKTGVDVDVAVRRLKEIVIAERRKSGRSQTLSLIHQYITGQIESLPPHVADAVEVSDRETLRRVFERLVEEVY